MPLYFLLGEFGSANARKEHLNEIVPRLQEDGRPLKNYPLTIESLEVELEELRSSAPISFEALRLQMPTVMKWKMRMKRKNWPWM